jgi:ribonuclease HII
MIDLDKTYPGYGFAGHKGYITKTHTDAIKELGVLPIHRKSFSNIAEIINKGI